MHRKSLASLLLAALGFATAWAQTDVTPISLTNPSFEADATSALDLETEYRLRQAVQTQFAGTTMIVVAQRIASIRDADRIAVMEEDGTIRHCAPHEQLLRESSTYRSLYESQMRDADRISMDSADQSAGADQEGGTYEQQDRSTS